MKVFIVLLFVAMFEGGSLKVAAEAVEQELENLTSMKKHAVAECSEKHNITKDAAKDILNHINVLDTEEVKCWLSCVLDKFGVMKESKKLDWERLMHLMKLGLIDEEDKNKVNKIIETCQLEVAQDETNECQLAYSVVVCKIDNWNKLGLPKENWEE